MRKFAVNLQAKPLFLSVMASLGSRIWCISMKFGPDDEQCGRGCTEDAPQFEQDLQCNYNAPRPTRNTSYQDVTVVSYIITVQYNNLEPIAWKTQTIHRFVEDIRASTSHVRNHFKCLTNHYRVHIMKHMIRKHWN